MTRVFSLLVLFSTCVLAYTSNNGTDSPAFANPTDDVGVARRQIACDPTGTSYHCGNRGYTQVPNTVWIADTEQLALNKNKITFIPAKAFNGLTLMRALYLGGNAITLIPDGMVGSNPALWTLGLADNDIVYNQNMSLNITHWAILLVLGFLDCTVMAAYIQMGLSKGLATKYGKIKIVTHTLAGLGLLVTGICALAAHAVGCFTTAQVFNLALGLTAIVNGFGALALAPYTSGVEGYNMVGYSAYSVFFISTGIQLFQTPITATSSSNIPGVILAYECWVVAHAYLMCRLFVMAVHKTCSSFLQDKMRYAVGTSAASGFSLFLAYGLPGLQSWALMLVVAIIADLAGIGSLHVNSRRKQRRLASSPQADNTHARVGVFTGLSYMRTYMNQDWRTMY